MEAPRAHAVVWMRNALAALALGVVAGVAGGLWGAWIDANGGVSDVLFLTAFFWNFAIIFVPVAVAVGLALEWRSRGGSASLAAGLQFLGTVVFCAVGFLFATAPEDLTGIPWQFWISLAGVPIVTGGALAGVAGAVAYVVPRREPKAPDPEVEIAVTRPVPVVAPPKVDTSSEALRVAKQRLAHGEIDGENYKRLVALLSD